MADEKKITTDLVRKLSGEKKELSEEKKLLTEEKKKLLAREKAFERKIIEYQDVARQRAESEDKMKEQVEVLEKKNKELKLACKNQSEKISALELENESCRQLLLKSCETVRIALRSLGADISLLSEENTLAAVGKWFEEFSIGLKDSVTPFASRCSKTAVESLSADRKSVV